MDIDNGYDCLNCSSITCQNGGNCADSSSGPTCTCKSGWTGEYCEQQDFCNRSYYFDMFHYVSKETISKNLHTDNILLSNPLNIYNSTLNRVLYKFLCLYKESYYKDENGMYTHQPRLYNFPKPYTVDVRMSGKVKHVLNITSVTLIRA
jgi:hypothetical protein